MPHRTKTNTGCGCPRRKIAAESLSRAATTELATGQLRTRSRSLGNQSLERSSLAATPHKTTSTHRTAFDLPEFLVSSDYKAHSSFACRLVRLPLSSVVRRLRVLAVQERGDVLRITLARAEAEHPPVFFFAISHSHHPVSEGFMYSESPPNHRMQRTWVAPRSKGIIEFLSHGNFSRR